VSFFLLQKKPDGATAWDDHEGESYNFAQRLPGAKNLCKNDVVFFYRPLSSRTPQDGCIYAAARVARVELHEDGRVDAALIGFRWFHTPVALERVGDPRANPQHSFQKIRREFASAVFDASETDVGDLR
jgi:hypothetical protein